MVSPLSSVSFDIPHNLDITKLIHYDIIHNMVTVQKPVGGIRIVHNFFNFNSAFLFFVKIDILDPNSIAFLYIMNYALVMTTWAVTTDELMKITDLHIFILNN
jgi:hypothetical protein